jgi:hypothetical protein
LIEDIGCYASTLKEMEDLYVSLFAAAMKKRMTGSRTMSKLPSSSQYPSIDSIRAMRDDAGL